MSPPVGRSLFLLASLLLNVLSSFAHTFKYALSVLVHFQLVHDNFAWVNADRNTLAIRLLSGDSFDMDDVLEAVDGCDLPFATFV